MSGGTSGDARGISGWLRGGPWRAPYAVSLAVMSLACVVNVFSVLHETHGRLPVWQPVVWEATSLAAVLGAVWIIFRLIDWVQRRRPSWTMALALHCCAACVFSAMHCVGMWSLRRVAYMLAGAAYGWSMPLAQMLFEFRKDLVTYAVVALIYQATRPKPGPAPGPAPVRAFWDANAGAAAGGAGHGAMFDIRDGARLVRVPVADIAAVSSAGNYVEFGLTDGRRVLMRGTLAGVLGRLAPAGFVRVHRSWIINANLVRGVLPDGSGDYTLALADGARVPLSRRFPDALRQLRGAVLQPADSS